MSLATRLVAVTALAALSHGFPATPQVVAPLPPVPDSYASPMVPIPAGLQLPREQMPAIPFYPAPPAETLSAPQFTGVEPNYFQVPVPSQDLVAPVETEWNPSRDPKFYYELPSAVTKEELPTATFPKKYNKDIHVKSKPYSHKPKQEITLEPINESQYIAKQRDLQKTFHKLAKKENQKLIETEKVEGPTPLLSDAKNVRQYVPQTLNSDIFKNYKVRVIDNKILPYLKNLKVVDLDSQIKQSANVPEVRQQPKVLVPTKLEPETAKTTVVAAKRQPARPAVLKAEPVQAESSFEGDYDEPEPSYEIGLSPHLTSSLGIPHAHASSPKGERLNFHMVGHDGPMSYKWGYDTGKGHNRQFHFEERDKAGLVRGHYGYYDEHGKLRVVEYDAHPHHGFHASEAEGGHHHK